MIVCVCNGISDRHIKAAIKNGATTVEALSANLGVAAGCGTCRQACAELVAEHACPGKCGTHRPVFQLMPLAA